jgi:hypothetical protein
MRITMPRIISTVSASVWVISGSDIIECAAVAALSKMFAFAANSEEAARRLQNLRSSNTWLTAQIQSLRADGTQRAQDEANTLELARTKNALLADSYETYLNAWANFRSLQTVVRHRYRPLHISNEIPLLRAREAEARAQQQAATAADAPYWELQVQELQNLHAHHVAQWLLMDAIIEAMVNNAYVGECLVAVGRTKTHFRNALNEMIFQ